MTSKKRNSIKRRTNKQKSKFSGSRKRRRNKKTLKRRLVGGGELLYGGTLDLSYNFVNMNKDNIKLCAAKLNELYTTTLTDPRAINQDKRTKLLAILNKCFKSSSDTALQLKEPHIWSDVTPNNKIVTVYPINSSEPIYNVDTPYKYTFDQHDDSVRHRPLLIIPMLWQSHGFTTFMKIKGTIFALGKSFIKHAFIDTAKWINNMPIRNEISKLSHCIGNASYDLIKDEYERPNLKAMAATAYTKFLDNYKQNYPQYDKNYYEKPFGKYNFWNEKGINIYNYFFNGFFADKGVKYILRGDDIDDLKFSRGIYATGILFKFMSAEKLLQFNINELRYSNGDDVSPYFHFFDTLFSKNIGFVASFSDDNIKEYKNDVGQYNKSQIEYYIKYKKQIDYYIAEMNNTLMSLVESEHKRALIFLATIDEHTFQSLANEYTPGLNCNTINECAAHLKISTQEEYISTYGINMNLSKWRELYNKLPDNLTFDRENLNEIVRSVLHR